VIPGNSSDSIAKEFSGEKPQAAVIKSIAATSSSPHRLMKQKSTPWVWCRLNEQVGDLLRVCLVLPALLQCPTLFLLLPPPVRGQALGFVDVQYLDDDEGGPTLESEEAFNVFGAGEPVDPSERLVIVLDGGEGAVQDPAFHAGVADLVAELGAASAPIDGADTPTFDELLDPFTAPAEAGLVSTDGTTVQVVGNIPGESDRVEALLAPVPEIVDLHPQGDRLGAARGRQPAAGGGDGLAGAADASGQWGDHARGRALPADGGW